MAQSRSYCLFLVFILVLFSTAWTAETVTLTEEEQAWLHAHPVLRVGAETDWPPFDFVANGRATGLSNDYVRLLAKKLNWKAEFVHGPTFAELIEMAKKREVDLLPALWLNEERQEYLNFSLPYYETSHAIFVQSDIDVVDNVVDLNGLRLVGVAGYNSTKQLYEHFPGASIQEVDSPLAALIAINNAEADAYIGSLAIGSHYIHENGLSGIRVVNGLKKSVFASNEALHVAMRKDWDIGARLMRKAQLAVTPEEMAALRHRWIILPKHGLVDWSYVVRWLLAAGFVILTGFGAFWVRNRRLSRELERRLEADRAIAKNRANLIEVMEATEDGIWSLDREYRATIVNSAFQRSYESAFGRPIEIGDSLLEEADEGLAAVWQERYDRVLAGERFTITDHVSAEKEADDLDLEFRFSPIEVNGKVIGATCTMHDVSVQKRLERNLRSAKDDAEQANSMKSMFLANMSHEIRTPMNGIIGLAELLSESDLPETSQVYVNELQGCADSLLSLIDDILNFSKIEAGKLEIENIDFDMRLLIRQIVTIINRSTPIAQ